MRHKRHVIALGSRLRKCRNVETLGVRPNFKDYSEDEIEKLRQAEKIYYPTSFYADLFDATGKSTFPSYHTYKCVQDKIRQTALLNMLQIPHPRTRVFHGGKQKQRILDYFQFPFIGKIPRGSARGEGVFLIRNQEELQSFCALSTPAYIQEYLSTNRDIRVLVIGEKVVHAYWRIASEGEFRCNVSLGAEISFDPIPQAALDLALSTAKACKWDDVGLDICYYKGDYYVLEANMKYGKAGFRAAGIDYYELMEELIDHGDI